MTTEISRVAPSRQLSLPTRDIADLVTRYMNHIERESYASVIITVAIAPDDRRTLTTRLAEVWKAITVDDAKFERARIDKAVSYMITMFTVGRKFSDLEAEATARGYVVALDGLPAHFVEQACMDFAKGRVKGHDISYTPTSAQVRVRAEELMAPYREEAGQIRLLLSAKQRIKLSPEEHARMLVKTRAVIDGTDPDIKAMRDRVDKDRTAQRERQAIEIGRANEIQRRRYCDRYGIDPDGLASPSLVMKIRGIGKIDPAMPRKAKAPAKRAAKTA